MTITTAPLCLEDLPQDMLERVAELLCGHDRRSLLHLALAAPAFYAICLHVAICTDKNGGKLDSIRPNGFRFANDSPDSVNIQGAMVGTVQQTNDLDVDLQPLWHLILLPRAADRSLLMPMMGKPIHDSVVVADRRWSLLSVPVVQIRRFTAVGPKRDCDWTAGGMPPASCTDLRLSQVIDFGMLKMPRSVVKLVLDKLEDVMLAPDSSDGGGSSPLPHLRECCISFNKSLTLDREKSVAAATALFALVPPSLMVLKLADLGEHVMQDAADLVRRLPCLAELHMFVYEYCNIKGMDLVMAALPRTGFPYLHLVLDTLDMRDSIDFEEEEAMIAQLADSLPDSVHSLALFSNSVWLPRVPLVTTSLTIDMDVILDAKSLRVTPNSLPPPLTHLVLKQGLAPIPILQLLPASLVHLELSYVNLSGDALLVLERSFPPHLESLILSGHDLTAADLDETLTGTWPLTLTHLDLSLGFEFEGRLPMIPPTVRVLAMDLAHALKSAGGEAMVAAWIMNLPLSMRVLKLYLNSACRSNLIDVMLTVAHVRMPGWPRMYEWNDAVDLPAAVWDALAARFGSFDVSYDVDRDAVEWGRMFGDFLS